MATNEVSYNYVLVDNDDVLKQSLQELKSTSTKDQNSLLAVDCEGVDLSRKGELTIVTVATEEKAYIFDVVKLKHAVFDQGLRAILEDKTRKKLMFDCREDSDALFHQFQAKLDGVLDIQLLEIIQRSPKRSKTAAYQRRSMLVDDIQRLKGFGHCIEVYVKDKEALSIKDRGKSFMRKSSDVWKERPIDKSLLSYCAVDTILLFKLYKELKSEDEHDLARLRVASMRYVELYREKTERLYDDYETNGYLPLDIIPEKGTLTFPVATTQCVTCKRFFPREEFSKTQLRNFEPKCRVCKEIKRLDDVEANRQDNWFRASCSYRRYNRYDDDSDDYYIACSDDEYDWLFV